MGLPGDFIADLPLNAFIHPAGLPIDTSTIKVLRRPVESAQYTSVAFGESQANNGILPSTGSVGDSYDNALMESINGLYKNECIKPDGPIRTWAQVEYATAEWVDWHNHDRLHSTLGYRPPAEHEQAH